MRWHTTVGVETLLDLTRSGLAASTIYELQCGYHQSRLRVLKYCYLVNDIRGPPFSTDGYWKAAAPCVADKTPMVLAESDQPLLPASRSPSHPQLHLASDGCI